MNVGSLFSGIGGLDLGLERAGMRVKWQCEIDPYCRAVLAHHWPGLPIYEDIKDIDESTERVDLICGGFPCQPVSLAGKGLAQEDPRWLWPEFARVVGLLRPSYVLVENVPGLVKRGLSDVITGLAEMGYDAEWEIVSAAACGASHLRERIFVVASHADTSGEHGFAVDAEVAWASQSLAYTDDFGRFGRARYFTEENWRKELAYRSSGDVQHPDSSAVESWRIGRRTTQASGGWWWSVEPDVGRVAHGVPNRLAQLRALGNAVVPQVAEVVGRMILEADSSARKRDGYCPHGVWVGGMGIDWMCGRCEDGEAA